MACSGVITLTDVRTEVGHSKYKVAAGKSGTISVGLLADGKSLIAGAKKHTIKVTETITVTGGSTVKVEGDPGRLGHGFVPAGGRLLFGHPRPPGFNPSDDVAAAMTAMTAMTQ